METAGRAGQRIIDSHCHIYPAKVADRAVGAVDSFYGGLPVEPFDGTTGTLLLKGKAAGITQFVVHSVATTPGQVPAINRFIAEEVKQSDGAFIGLGALHPDSETLREDTEHLMELGLKGVKIHPDFQKFFADEPKAMRLFELCEEKSLPVLVHTGDYRYDYSNPERIAHVLQAFPDLTLIGAHFGGWSVWDRAQALLPDYPNMMVDTSSSFFWMEEERALDMIRAYGPERVMFGTDYPMWRADKELAFFSRLDLTEEERQRILWKNCARLYGAQGFLQGDKGSEY
ncbi:MAG: amidohydrolase family protein [Lachnospiraceae bacterium]|nr:amidohydrolase family protein [Lachnospiraceae bacterium]